MEILSLPCLSGGGSIIKDIIVDNDAADRSHQPTKRQALFDKDLGPAENESAPLQSWFVERDPLMPPHAVQATQLRNYSAIARRMGIGKAGLQAYRNAGTGHGEFKQHLYFNIDIRLRDGPHDRTGTHLRANGIITTGGCCRHRWRAMSQPMSGTWTPLLSDCFILKNYLPNGMRWYHTGLVCDDLPLFDLYLGAHAAWTTKPHAS